MTEVKTAWRTAIRTRTFAMCNGLVFVAFSVLWVKEYHMTNSDQIDHIVVPWLWLGSFFCASLCAVRSIILRSLVISLTSAVILSGALLLFVHIILAPIFGPWF